MGKGAPRHWGEGGCSYTPPKSLLFLLPLFFLVIFNDGNKKRGFQRFPGVRPAPPRALGRLTGVPPPSMAPNPPLLQNTHSRLSEGKKSLGERGAGAAACAAGARALGDPEDLGTGKLGCHRRRAVTLAEPGCFQRRRADTCSASEKNQAFHLSFGFNLWAVTRPRRGREAFGAAAAGGGHRLPALALSGLRGAPASRIFIPTL